MRTLGVLLASLALVGVASAARTATVTVRDASLAPARVRIDAGGSVTWRNAGVRSHRIASRTGAFAAFSLASGGRKTVRFTRNGAHRYTVDGSRCGIVYVGVTLGPACSGGGGGGAATPPPVGTRFYNYDVVLRGTIKNEGFIDSGGRRTDTWVRDLTWTSTFRNFRFKVVTAASKFIGINANDTFVNSTAQVTETWDWLWHPHSAFPPSADCDGRESGTVPYRLFASASNLASPNFRVSGQAQNGWHKLELMEADCSGFGPPSIHAPEFTWNGMRLDPDVGTLTITFERATGGLANPVSQIANGRGFTLDTGVQTSQEQTCSGDCSGTLTITHRYVAVFTPRR